ncbi:DNA adenine methylase [Lactococcus raffinolactis]|uniref:DNA adenine methylase n=1 Tax=Pseudolactococcus raffinolactis TaxID=1366 RepID=UPI00110805CD|nr:DNA adenine methylase [Lactococcus raffinolactis]TLQ15669.1 DNA adenine methylase [Lactococcus raffinolactis]
MKKIFSEFFAELSVLLLFVATIGFFLMFKTVEGQGEQLDAIELIEKMNDDDTLIYADPPYMNETASSKTHYKFGMADDQHMKLLSTLKNHRGPVILSGYNSDLYAKELKGWSKIEFDSATGNVGRKKKIAIECLWYNFDPVEQMELFKLEV